MLVKASGVLLANCMNFWSRAVTCFRYETSRIFVLWFGSFRCNTLHGLKKAKPQSLGAKLNVLTKVR